MLKNKIKGFIMSIKYLLLLSCCFALSSWANQVENRLGSVSIFDKKINFVAMNKYVSLGKISKSET